ncbi:hypothetical protein [Haliscomenobacter hydrossis]|uniref:Uncharacterized protein n=1 Tax=Haliscomenobacter hydrossis (strain ATCC 27775 / DSM 1100 / LMG 10767 / O) TaxID=760192 RepID=F4KZ85_HALH1|nr:hypothetical protein [Haliscomenobacter hydrossis]AEE53739.1 hypothetical protein Halhy_5916 [Haliscomenobacter hydrossis DSM 1100]
MYQFTGQPANNANQNKGGGFDKALNTGNTVLDTVNRVLCTINPNRPGCVPINETTIIEQQRRNTWLIVGLFAVIAVLGIVLIRKK